MRSPRTDATSARPRRHRRGERLRRLVQRLNVRFVVALWSVALVGLVISAVAINQILPNYFREQAEERIETAATSIALVTLEQTNAQRAERPSRTQVPELRRVYIYAPTV